MEKANAAILDARFNALADSLSSYPAVSRGKRKGFGSGALTVHGRIFAMPGAGGALVVKLPSRRVDELVKTGMGQRYDPGRGRLMKEWLVLMPTSENDWLSLAAEAYRFVKNGAI